MFMDFVTALLGPKPQRTAHNMGFSAMLAEEYILVDISLSATSLCDLSSQHQLKFIQHYNSFYL
jgi:hypothetical protein